NGVFKSLASSSGVLRIILITDTSPMINTTTIANSASIRAFTHVFWRENLLRFGGFFCSISFYFFYFCFSSSIPFLSKRDVYLLILVTLLYVKSLLTLTDDFLKNVLLYVVLFYECIIIMTH